MKTVTLFLFVLHGLCTSAQPPFTLIISRAVGSNSIALQCRDSEVRFDPQAMYFRNGTRLDSVDGFIDTSQDPSRVVFLITRRLEGEYSCGTELQRSNPLLIIAFPDMTVIPPRRPTYVLAGETARLNCGIQPGALPGQYFAGWLNGTDGRTLYYYPAPLQRFVNPSLEMRESDRYTIDPSNLSLMIANVQLNDTLGSYRCELGVEDPRSPGPTRMTYTYMQTRNYNIVLKVIAPPRIIREFISNTLTREGQDVVFRCVAQGFPAPTISWQHAGREVVTANNPRFEVNSTKSSDGFIRTVTSYLKLASADDSTNGEVKCIAHPPPSETVGGMILDRAYTSSQLSVLGSFNDLEIEITTRSDVIIIVNLQRALPVPVHLVLVYRNAGSPSTQPDSKVTQAAYVNTSEIRHIDFASQVPFQRFTVEVGLYSEGVQGPLIRAQGEYDKSRPTVPMQTLSMTAIIILGVVPGTVCLVITIVTGLVCCICHQQTLNYRLNSLIAKNPPQVLDKLHGHLETKEDVEYLIQEKLINLVKVGIPHLDPNKKRTVSYSTQGSNESTSRQFSSQTSSSLHRAEDNAENGDDNNYPDCPDVVINSPVELSNNHMQNSNVNRTLLAPPSYEAAISQTATMEPELMNLLANFVCDSVRATLHQDHNPELANHVETAVQEHVIERQRSVESRIRQLQSQQMGTPI